MNESPAYAIPDQVPAPVRALLCAVREGSAEDAARLVGVLGDPQRRTCLPVLKSWRKAHRDDRAEGVQSRREALLAAGAGCCTGAAAAAQWLGSSELWWFDLDYPPAVLTALGDRDPEWLGQVAHRMAQRESVAMLKYPLIAQLLRVAGCEPPLTDGFVLGWEAGMRIHGWTVRDRLRDDPFLTAMVPRLFEVPEAGGDLQHTGPGEWPEALVGLAAEGRLSREMLIDGCLSRLTRGGRLGIVRGFLVLLTALDLTEDERAARTLSWVRMLPDAPALAAARAQEVLAGLDEAGRLETEHLVEASRAALFRPEKKIVRAQLAMLDKAMKRVRANTDTLLPVAAEAFGHEEHSLQDRALALVVRHRRHAGDAALAEVAASAQQLAPDLRQRAAEAFGDAMTAEAATSPAPPVAEGDLLPPVPGPERLGPVQSPVELAEELGALLRGRGTPAQEERVLNSLVVHAHTDRAGLRAALEPVAARHREPASWLSDSVVAQALEFVVSAVMSTATSKDRRALSYRAQEYQCPHTALWSVHLLRAAEIGWRLESGEPLPFLLATPTWSTGTIAPAELVARLAAYERSGVEPGLADFEQALLRLDREVPPEALTAAAELTSPAGRRLAARLTSGGLPDPVVSRDAEALRLRSPRPGVLVRTEAFPGHEDLPEPFRSLLGAHDPVGSPCKCSGQGQCSPQALALLPQHREVLAARMLVTFADLAELDDLKAAVRVLPALAESGGPAGPATHLLLAYGLGARRPEEQLFAVDAVLVLAARGQLDAARLGQDIAELTGLRRLKPQRYAAALREAANTGADTTVWAVLSAVLPPLLAGEAPHGLTALLTLAAECAERTGGRGPIPGVEALAARSGSSQLVKQARRIRDVTSR
ncbi:DUF6493 family protein [Streptomyces sp. NPDC059740]|uniref:DUF7824 domain-containing protein n=1 Tax=Streptomyces sp. NPDC059740 TaxID=3346926 RepID=UPI003667F4F0